jgi:RNA polymerase sigma factor (sigma-70 family)
MSTDAALLRRYLQQHDEPAFAELVQRHLDLVYGAAFRRTGGRAHLAEDVAQKVFCDLARKAAALAHHPSLTGWLHRSTRYAAVDAARAELRRQKLAQSFTAMPDDSSTPESLVDWERLRPVIDDALDQLKERDREIVLLRFFNGLTFAEAGTRLGLSEDTARKRAERALDKLRTHLGRRGVTSTTAALGMLLSSHSFGAAPAGLATTVTAAAMASAPSGVIAGVVSFFLMNKIAISFLSAGLAAGVTAVVWTAVADDVSSEELTALHRENARLTAATSSEANGASVAAVADEYATNAIAVARAMKARQLARASAPAAATPTGASAEPEVTARGHRDHGRATAHDAAMTFAWAGDISDPAAFSDLLYFDGNGREKALEVLASMPGPIRELYPTPEELYGLFLAASTLEAPPPGADLMERLMVVVELRPGRAATRKVGSDANYHEYQQTPDGWKWVIPERIVSTVMPGWLNSRSLEALSER